MKDILKNDWKDYLASEFESDYYLNLRKFLVSEYNSKVIYPNMYDIFNALHYTSYKDTKGRTRYIGYHFIIHQDGTIEECRPISKIGCHASGHNTRSIGISYVGGLDARDTNGRMIKDTRTPQQKASLIKLIKQLKAKYPTIKRVIGHRDTSPDLNGNGIIEPYEYIKGCPCFDAIPEYKNI